MAGDDLERLRRLLLERSVRRGDFVLASGQRSSYYIDCRLTTMSAEGQGLIGRLGWRAIKEKGLAAEGGGRADDGGGSGGVRDRGGELGDRPGDGRVQREEGSEGARDGAGDRGVLRRGDEVVIVEDVITTGGSAQRAIEAVTVAGGVVLGVLAVVDRGEGGRARLEGEGREVVALVEAAELR